VFTGVSGSGKSSLVFGTIAAESQRMINETYSAFVQGFMPTLAGPDVDVLEGLTTAIVGRPAANGRRRPLHGRHRHRRQRRGCCASSSARLGKTPHRPRPRRSPFNVGVDQRRGCRTPCSAPDKRQERRSFSITGGMCPRCEGGARSPT